MAQGMKEWLSQYWRCSNTQKAIVTKAVEKGADYLLPVKENHPLLYEEIELMFLDLERRQERAKQLWRHHVNKAKAR